CLRTDSPQAAFESLLVDRSYLLGDDRRWLLEPSLRRLHGDPVIVAEVAAGDRHHEHGGRKLVHVVIGDDNGRPGLANLATASRIELDHVDRTPAGKGWLRGHLAESLGLAFDLVETSPGLLVEGLPFLSNCAALLC